ncbi:MAG: type II secretion system F family protein [Phycisphaerae bacterium]|nr:type II secretion system F family protein [Phycisphaerae bacterium]
MPVFTYVARDDTGALVEDEVTASSQAQAAKIVRGEGKFVVRVAPKQGASGFGQDGHAHTGWTESPSSARSAKGSRIFREKYRPDDLIFFTNQLAVMVETGVSLSEALEACTHEGNSPRFAKALDRVIDKVTAGSEFSAALAECPDVFPTVYVSLMKASEASGQMGSMLERLARHLEDQRVMTKKIKGAITYPIVMFVFAIGVTIFLMTFVLPKFGSIYAGKEDSLPSITRALLVFSDVLVAYGLYVLGGLVAASVGLFLYFRTPAGRLKAEAIKLGLPLLGPLFHKAYLARSLHTLGTMIQSGVSMLDGVRLTASACGSMAYEKMWNTVNDRLETGQQVSEALADSRQVPRAINKMLSAGERSGQLGPVMGRVAKHCEAELNTAIKAMTSLLEPAIVMFLGVVVGGLVLALLLPIFTISKALK